MLNPFPGRAKTPPKKLITLRLWLGPIIDKNSEPRKADQHCVHELHTNLNIQYNILFIRYLPVNEVCSAKSLFTSTWAVVDVIFGLSSTWSVKVQL